MQVAIVGATGFVGSYLIDALLTRHHEPVALVRAGSESKLNRAGECRTVTGDLDDEAAIRSLLDGCDAVIYNVGILREAPARGMTFERLQHEGARKVVNLAAAAGVDRFLLMSANGVREDGTAYQTTKWRAERYALESELAVTVFRPSVIFGDPAGRMEIATQLYRDMVRPPIPAVDFFSAFGPHRGPVMMSPVYAGDVADAFVASLESPDTIGRIYELGGPETLRWGDMIRRVAEAVGKRKLLIPTPIEVMRLAALLFDWLPFFPVTRAQLTMLAEGNTADPEALARLVGRAPKAFTPAALAYLGSG